MATALTFKQIAEALDLTKSGFADYPGLKLLADNIHADFERYTGRMLVTYTRTTEKFILDDTEINIPLKLLPLDRIDSLTVDGETVDVATTKKWSYGFRLQSYMSGEFEVTYFGGEFTYPEDLIRAELAQVVYEFPRMSEIAVTNVSNAGGTTTTPGFTLLKHVKDILDQYKHVNKLGFA